MLILFIFPQSTCHKNSFDLINAKLDKFPNNEKNYLMIIATLQQNKYNSVFKQFGYVAFLRKRRHLATKSYAKRCYQPGLFIAGSDRGASLSGRDGSA